ncbi:MAG: hypothetical protein M3O70_25455, partial [Actinomycetota bacterium]|nr:hypothetical protein [Actinomycetota bacterium]
MGNGYRTRSGLGEQAGDARQVTGQGGHPNCSYPRLVEDGRETVGVVRVRVAEDDEVEVPLTLPAQPPGCSRIGSAIDEDSGAGGLDEDGVALADVDGSDDEAADGRSESEVRDDGPDERTYRHYDGDLASPRPSSGEDPGQARHEDEERRGSLERHDTAPAAEPVGRAEDDREGRTGENERGHAEGGVGGGKHAACGCETRRHRGGGYRDEVGGKRGKWHLAGIREQEGRDGDLST